MCWAFLTNLCTSKLRTASSEDAQLIAGFLCQMAITAPNNNSGCSNYVPPVKGPDMPRADQHKAETQEINLVP
jgi:hypothetical protein